MRSRWLTNSFVTSGSLSRAPGQPGWRSPRFSRQKNVGDIVAIDSRGIISSDREFTDSSKVWMQENTNSEDRKGELLDALDGADVFIGVSAADLFDAKEITRMNDKAIVFGLANPDPEFNPHDAKEFATVVATGRSDFPNQINNVLAFPGVFRGALDARAPAITGVMNVAAARAIAAVVRDDQRHASYIIPSVFNPDVSDGVAKAVRVAAVGG